MADITSPQAVQFCNEEIRVVADLFEQLYWSSKKLDLNWNTTYSALIPNTVDVIVDGAATDGRKIITGQMVNNIINRAFEFITDQEAAGNAKLNTVLQVSVNGQSRF